MIHSILRYLYIIGIDGPYLVCIPCSSIDTFPSPTKYYELTWYLNSSTCKKMSTKWHQNCISLIIIQSRKNIMELQFGIATQTAHVIILEEFRGSLWTFIFLTYLWLYLFFDRMLQTKFKTVLSFYCTFCFSNKGFNLLINIFLKNFYLINNCFSLWITIKI